MRIQKKKQEVLEGDLTPMIDMTFQLIAFFMVLVNFTQADQQEAIKLPDSELAKPSDEKPKYPIVLNMTVDGKVILAGKTVELESLGLDLDLEKTAAARKGLEPNEITVIIRAHQEAQTGDIQELIKVCQENNLETFALRVKEKVN